MALHRKDWDLLGPVARQATRQISSAVSDASCGSWLIVSACAGLMIYAVLAYGAVHTWSYLPLGLLLACLSLVLLAKGSYILYVNGSAAVNWLRPPLWGGFLAAVVLALLQTVPLPRWLVGLISPMAVQIRALGNGYGLASYFPLSLNPGAGMLEFLKLWPALTLFFILLYSVQSPKQIQRLAELILALALFEVLFGFWHFHDRLIWGWKNPYGSPRLCGTFINTNHLAGYLSIAILLGFGLFLAQKRGTISQVKDNLPARSRLSHWSRPEHLEPQFRHGLFIVILIFLTVGLCFTGSRGGIVSLLVGFTMMGLLMVGQRWQKGYLWLMILLPIIAGAYSLWIGGAPFLSRLLDLSNNHRYQASLGALSIFREFPVMGSGIGTFGTLFYRFEPAQFRGEWFNYAHNEWLQVLAESGILGFLLLIILWLIFFIRLVKQWQRSQGLMARGLGLGCLAALAAGAFQALGEFPFRIPGFSLTYAAIAAIAYLALHHVQDSPEQFADPSENIAIPRWLTALMLCGLLVLQVLFMTKAWFYWQAERVAPTEIDSTSPPSAIGAMDLHQAISLNPKNSLYYLLLAKELEKEPHGLKQVEKLLRKAIYLAPAKWAYHLWLAEFYQKHYRRDPAVNLPKAVDELNAAVKLFPESGRLHLRLGLFLAWVERYHPGLVAPEMRGRWMFHLEKAVKLEPSLKQYLKSRKN
jgi:O-antigen ligase